MLKYFFNVLFWFICLLCFYFTDRYILEMRWNLPFEDSLMVTFLLSMLIPAFVKFAMKWELLSFKKIKTMKKSEFIKLLRSVLVANGILFMIAYYVVPEYFALYSFAGMTLCIVQVAFGIIQNKRETLY